MAGRTANCPNCGGGVSFRAGTSLLTVCPYCSSTVARVGGDITHLEITGRVAPLAEVGSPLALGMRGSLRNRRFVLLGRAQYDFGAGPWNEWYAAFEDGRWGWIAEAQGSVIATFEAARPEEPTFDTAQVGQHVWLSDHRFTIVERREAKMVSAEGELPFPVHPDASFRYCDLRGPGRSFATLDYGDGSSIQHLYFGEALRYSDLFDVSALGAAEPAGAPATAAVGLNCPSCGAGVELQVPDRAMRVTCGRCEALLDCEKGSELFLLQSAKAPSTAPRLPLGSRGDLFGDDYLVLGHLVRSVTVDGVRYPWEEYLLHSRTVGYRWLVEANGHWTFVEPISAGDVIESARTARYAEQSHRHFTSGIATVEALRGEFYWKVSVGETVTTADYVRPPHVISKERSQDEVNWSRGTYIPAQQIADVFGVEARWPRARGVAPSQPNPHREPLRRVSRAAFMLTGALVVLAAGLALWQRGYTVVDARFRVDPSAKKPVATEPFELKRQGNLAIRASAPVDNSWLYLDGQLVHLATNEITRFGIEVSFYRGVTGGERWSEGGRDRTVYLGSILPGRYTIRLQPQGPKTRSKPMNVRIVAKSRVFLMSHALIAFGLLWLLPLLKGATYMGFEKRRWSESDHAE